MLVAQPSDQTTNQSFVENLVACRSSKRSPRKFRKQKLWLRYFQNKAISDVLAPVLSRYINDCLFKYSKIQKTTSQDVWTDAVGLWRYGDLHLQTFSQHPHSGKSIRKRKSDIIFPCEYQCLLSQ